MTARIRRQTAREWRKDNPILGVDEPGIDTNVDRIKYGDGKTRWKDLPFAEAASAPVVEALPGGIDVYDNTKEYKAGQNVAYEGSLWKALIDTVGTVPSKITQTIKATSAAYADAGYVNTQMNAFMFTPLADMTISHVTIRTAASQQFSTRFDVFIAPAFGIGVTPTPLNNTQGVSNLKTHTSETVVVTGTTVALTGEVLLTAGTPYALVVNGIGFGVVRLSVTTANTPSPTGITTQGAVYGDSFAGSQSNATYHGRFDLLSTEQAKWTALAVSPVTTNAAGTAVVPVDINDSWVVGSDRTSSSDTARAGRAFFNKTKAAFRAGFADGAQWDDANIGNYSHAEGYRTTASSASAHAEGQSTTASGSSSHAEGNGSIASGAQSHAEGNNTTASGTVAHAEGSNTVASGLNSHAEGFGSVAGGNQSHAEGGEANAPRYMQWARSSGKFSAAGDAQAAAMVLRISTTDATAVALTSWGTSTISFSGGDTNVLTLPVSRAFQLKISTVARRTDVQGEAAGWTWEGLINRNATGNAVIIGTPIVAAWGAAGAAAWDLAVSINTTDATNNYVAVTATGEAAKTIRWVSKLEWTEVGG